VPYFGTARSQVGSVAGSLAYGRAVGLEVAGTFTRLAGGAAAMVATQVRFFQQQGYSTTAAVTSGAVVSAASLIVKGTLFLIAIPVAWRSFHFGNSLHQGGHAKILVLILALTAGGIAKNDATAAVFVQRLFSAYLPPVVGWFTFMWMRRREYL
jgi:hypothetical protein